MFGKLFKHDFKAILRYGIPMLIAIAVVGVVGTANYAFMTSLMARSITEQAGVGYALLSLVSVMLNFIVTLAFVAIPTVIQVLLLIDFYKSTASDEAYLTFTLPVTPTQILSSKLLNSIIWSFIMFGASVLAGFAMYGIGELTTEAMLGEFMVVEGTSLGIGDIPGIKLMIALLILYAVVTIIVSQLLYFLAISFSSSISKKNKALSAVGFSVLANFVYGIINYIILIVSVIVGVFTGVVSENPFLAINIALGVMNIVSIGIGVLFFFLTRAILTKKLNLA